VNHRNYDSSVKSDIVPIRTVTQYCQLTIAGLLQLDLVLQTLLM